MNNTIHLKAAENLQLGVLASAAVNPDGETISREMICSIIDNMIQPIRRLMIIDTSNLHYNEAGPIVIYNVHDGSMKQLEVSMPIVDSVCSFNIGLVEDNTFLVTQGDNSMLMNIDGCIPRFTRITVANSKHFTCGSEANMVKLHDGRLLLFDGTYGYRKYRRTHRIFDDEKRAWVEISKNNKPNRHACCVVMFNGRVLLAGGSSDITYGEWDKCWIFNVLTRKFTDTTRMNVGRVCPSGCLLPSGHVFVCGGGGHEARVCETYNPKTSKWTRGGSIFHDRTSHAVCLIDHDKVFISGGIEFSALARCKGECEIYNLTTETSTLTTQKMPVDMRSSTIIPLYD